MSYKLSDRFHFETNMVIEEEAFNTAASEFDELSGKIIERDIYLFAYACKIDITVGITGIKEEPCGILILADDSVSNGICSDPLLFRNAHLASAD